MTIELPVGRQIRGRSEKCPASFRTTKRGSATAMRRKRPDLRRSGLCGVASIKTGGT